MAEKKENNPTPVSPWVEHPEIWKTKSSYMSWIRGGIRRGLWMRHPLKMAALKSSAIMIDNTNPRSMKRFPKVKAYKCEICLGVFKSTEVECDHITGNHSLVDISDIASFIEGIVLVTAKDLRIICKQCHGYSTLAESRGITFEQAKVEEKVIEFGKLKSNKQVDKLSKLGYTPESNSKKRIEQFRKHIKGVG